MGQEGDKLLIAKVEEGTFIGMKIFRILIAVILTLIYASICK